MAKHMAPDPKGSTLFELHTLQSLPCGCVAADYRARTLSVELQPRGIRVNVISPGLIETPIYGKLGLPPEAVQAWAGQLLAKVPAARFGQAEEVAKAVLFLASDDSAYLLGENLLFDGGLSTL